ncbi:MAG: allantoinase AllB [Acidobacteriaceae bacterium]|nr:allantoinase AllB [Acidobacteriaceae bacterium]
MRLAIHSRRIVTPQGVRGGVIVVENGKIAALEPPGFAADAQRRIDAENLLVLPGLVDVHVHINEPGRTEWEGFETAAQAALAGGCTTLVDMPLNSIPSTTTVAALEEKGRALAQARAPIAIAFWGGVVPGNAAHILPLAEAGVRGFKCFLTHPGTEEFQMVLEADLREAMPRIAETGLPLLVHAETPEPLARARAQLEHADWTRYRTYLQSRPPAAELEAIHLLIRLCRQYRCRTHIVHLSTAAALGPLARARAEGLPITVETCPHYLFFEAESIPDHATLFKCAPPIREAANRAALWEGLRSGIIDLVATDHSPCPPAMKCLDTGNFQSAWGGISSLSLALSIVWTEARRLGFEIADVVRWMAEAPSQLAGFASVKGRIAPGFDADLVLFDPDAEFEVTPDRLPFRHPCTPYLGQTLVGQVRSVLVRGAILERAVFR